MKVIKFERDGFCAQGVLDGETIHILSDWLRTSSEQAPFDLPSWSLLDLEKAVSTAEKMPLRDTSLKVPIDPKRKIICVGMNYRDHTAEIKHESSENPVVFTRSLDTLCANTEALVHPVISDSFDFEGEIAIVIGKAGRNIPPEQALDHIFGYTCFMDGSVREYQRHSLTAGKNFWHSGAMGPWIVTADCIDQTKLTVETRLNGVVVQSGHIKDLIFNLPAIINYCSRFTHLAPGDVIATGTPGGVGSRRTPPLWMKPGDTIEVAVTDIGTLSNIIATTA